MAGSELLFSISKEALKLVQSGQATISSGGVRLLDGTIFELAKPAVSQGFSSLAGSIVSGNPVGIVTNVVNMASSLAQNVQSALIMRDLGVVGANVSSIGTQVNGMVGTLDGISSAIGVMNNNITAMGTGIESILAQCTSMSAALGSLQQITALSWVGTAFSLANCGISIVSFAMTMNKLSGIQKLMEEFHDQYTEDRKSDTNEKFWNCYLNLKNDIGKLNGLAEEKEKDPEYISLKGYSHFFEEHINETASFIRKLLHELTGKTAKNRTNIKIILPLYAILAQTINEYCCLYYYAFRQTHHMLDEWNSFLHDVTSEDFHYALRQHLMQCEDYISIHPAKKKQAYLLSVESTSELKSRFETCKTVIDQLPEGEYYNLDKMLNRQLYHELQTQIPSLRNLDETLIEYIENNQYITDNARPDHALVCVSY